MININVNVSKVRSAANRLQRRIKDVRPFFEGEASDIIYGEIRKTFDTEGYGSWRPLNRAYAREKMLERPGKSILRWSDAYYRSATSRGGPGSVHIATNRTLRIGVDATRFEDQYPLKHERGDVATPKRPVFAIAGPQVREPVSRALRRYFFKEV